MAKLIAAFVFAVGICSSAWATTCGPATLADYISGPPCSYDGLTYSGFSYSGSATGGATAVPASEISVVLSFDAPESSSLMFQAFLDITSGQTLSGTIAYTVTPGVWAVHQVQAQMGGDVAFRPATIGITETLDSPVFSLSLHNPGNQFSGFSGVGPWPLAFTVTDSISISASSGGNAGLGQLRNSFGAQTPEPASLVLVSLGLVAYGILRRSIILS